MDLHGPYEQTYITQELDFTQGTILAVDTKNMMITVQARLTLHDNVAIIQSALRLQSPTACLP